MNWILASLLMFTFSIIYYSIIKISQRNGINRKLYMVANFSIPAILFLLINLILKNSIFIPIQFIIILIIAALTINYLGSIISYIAIQKSPNAGYSLVIQKGYAVFTTIAAVFLFQSEFNISKMVLIIFILVCSAYVMIGKSIKTNYTDNKWIIYSLIAFLCFGLNNLMGKYFGTQQIQSTVFLFWMCFFVSIISIIDLFRTRSEIPFEMNKKKILIMLFLGLSVSIFYLFQQISNVTSPNLGYPNAINASSNAMFTIVSAFLFKDELDKKKLIAIIGVTIGIILLVI